LISTSASTPYVKRRDFEISPHPGGGIAGLELILFFYIKRREIFPQVEVVASQGKLQLKSSVLCVVWIEYGTEKSVYRAPPQSVFVLL
jgi:hypothetical protein